MGLQGKQTSKYLNMFIFRYALRLAIRQAPLVPPHFSRRLRTRLHQNTWCGCGQLLGRRSSRVPSTELCGCHKSTAGSPGKVLPRRCCIRGMRSRCERYLDRRSHPLASRGAALSGCPPIEDLREGGISGCICRPEYKASFLEHPLRLW